MLYDSFSGIEETLCAKTDAAWALGTALALFSVFLSIIVVFHFMVRGLCSNLTSKGGWLEGENTPGSGLVGRWWEEWGRLPGVEEVDRVGVGCVPY